MKVQFENISGHEEKPEAYSTATYGQGRRHVEVSDDECPRARRTVELSEVIQVVCRERSKMMVDKDVWVATREEICCPNAKMVRLDIHLALSNKCNHRLERKCNGSKVNM